jgi:hypothetical protein
VEAEKGGMTTRLKLTDIGLLGGAALFLVCCIGYLFTHPEKSVWTIENDWFPMALIFDEGRVFVLQEYADPDATMAALPIPSDEGAYEKCRGNTFKWTIKDVGTFDLKFGFNTASMYVPGLFIGHYERYRRGWNPAKSRRYRDAVDAWRKIPTDSAIDADAPADKQDP